MKRGHGAPPAAVIMGSTAPVLCNPVKFRVQIPRSPPGVRSRLLMAVLLGEPEEARRCRFGIELDEYHCLVTYDPGVVPRLHDHYLRRDELEGAAVSVLTTYVAPSQEADVCIHAKHGADERLEVR